MISKKLYYLIIKKNLISKKNVIDQVLNNSDTFKANSFFNSKELFWAVKSIDNKVLIF